MDIPSNMVLWLIWPLHIQRQVYWICNFIFLVNFSILLRQFQIYSNKETSAVVIKEKWQGIWIYFIRGSVWARYLRFLSTSLFRLSAFWWGKDENKRQHKLKVQRNNFSRKKKIDSCLTFFFFHMPRGLSC